MLTPETQDEHRQMINFLKEKKININDISYMMKK